jgi:hypothetical protein
VRIVETVNGHKTVAENVEVKRPLVIPRKIADYIQKSNSVHSKDPSRFINAGNFLISSSRSAMINRVN